MSRRQTETEMQKDRKRETHRFPLGKADRGDTRERRGRIGEKSWREKSEGGRWQALGKSRGFTGVWPDSGPTLQLPLHVPFFTDQGLGLEGRPVIQGLSSILSSGLGVGALQRHPPGSVSLHSCHCLSVSSSSVSVSLIPTPSICPLSSSS